MWIKLKKQIKKALKSLTIDRELLELSSETVNINKRNEKKRKCQSTYKLNQKKDIKFKRYPTTIFQI